MKGAKIILLLSIISTLIVVVVAVYTSYKDVLRYRKERESILKNARAAKAAKAEISKTDG